LNFAARSAKDVKLPVGVAVWAEALNRKRHPSKHRREDFQIIIQPN
jgi:hypothetical protein